MQLRGILRERRDRALDVLERHYRDLAVWNVPNGGFYIWLTLKNAAATEKLFESAAMAGILLNPGDMYDFARNGSLRLSYAYTTPDEFERAAIRLARIIRSETDSWH